LLEAQVVVAVAVALQAHIRAAQELQVKEIMVVL
jgi:hypothetical protein